MKTYNVGGFATVTVGVSYTGIEADSPEDAMRIAAKMFAGGDIRLDQNIDENSAEDFDVLFADLEEEI